MSRRPARFTQADVARSIRAAKQAGAAAVDIRPDGHIAIIDTLASHHPDVPIYAKTLDEFEAAGRGVVYFIGFGSWVKIGFAIDLQRRIDSLQTACPETLSVFHSLPGSIADERKFHKQFAELRHRGEWFRREGDLARWLDEASP